jgi:hypothetical protein
MTFAGPSLPLLPKAETAFCSSGANAPPLKSVAKSAVAQQHRPMLASVMTNLMYWRYWLASSPFTLIVSAFHLWMLIHAIRNREWFWAVFILFCWGLGAIWYYLYVYRASATRGFELPGAQKRRRIRELQAQIHHLDKAHHHPNLGTSTFLKANSPRPRLLIARPSNATRRKSTPGRIWANVCSARNARKKRALSWKPWSPRIPNMITATR